MKYNFDKIVNRRGTNSLKYDYAKESGKPESAMPLWVADMDFEIPPEATEAILECARHAVYGYTITKGDYDRAVIDWFARYFGFEGKPEWIVKTPGVVYALAMAVRAFTEENDAVMIQMPVYYPFNSVVTDNNRRLVDNPLVRNSSGRYHINFGDFEQKIKENKVKMFILCSPHNPVGRVWTQDELWEIGKICRRYNCLVVSDEIHCDLTFKGYTHHTYPTVCGLENMVLCTAPSKTFNLAGLQNSNIFIPDESLRTKFSDEIAKSGYSQLNTMGLAATKAVYNDGHDWLAELRGYLQGNLEFIKTFLAKNIPRVRLVEPEGTYLVWLDFSGYGLPHDKLDDMLLNQAGVWFGSGTSFGTGGEGFWRVNIACPRARLEEAMERVRRIG